MLIRCSFLVFHKNPSPSIGLGGSLCIYDKKFMNLQLSIFSLPDVYIRRTKSGELNKLFIFHRLTKKKNEKAGGKLANPYLYRLTTFFRNLKIYQNERKFK